MCARSTSPQPVDRAHLIDLPKDIVDPKIPRRRMVLA
jgi:hypothetical protein